MYLLHNVDLTNGRRLNHSNYQAIVSIYLNKYVMCHCILIAIEVPGRLVLVQK